MIRTLSVLLATSLLCRADDRGILAIRVVEGGDVVYAVGSRATRGITVLVSDEAGRPVDGATVSFALPAEGSGGVFPSGSRMEIVNTRDGGRASVWGMRWNRTPGHFEVRVTAVKGQARAAAAVAQYLSEATELKTVSPRGSGSHKILWIILAGGAASAVAGGAGRGSASSGASAPVAASLTGVRIGTPTITVGRP
ncbi:MAG: hypothetical protein EXQ47_04750 [Bryobacterales bacterium]|nr:hypothetical protein [Bryobacterales bacterium]